VKELNFFSLSPNFLPSIFSFIVSFLLGSNPSLSRVLDLSTTVKPHLRDQILALSMILRTLALFFFSNQTLGEGGIDYVASNQGRLNNVASCLVRGPYKVCKRMTRQIHNLSLSSRLSVRHRWSGKTI